MRPILAALVTATSTLTACHSHVYSPPARINPLEAPAPLGEDASSARIAVGGAGALFSYDATIASAAYARGISDDTDLVVEGNFVAFDDDAAAAQLDPYLWTLRAGVKWAPAVLGHHVAVVAGLGAGYAPEVGGSVSPDLGIVAGFENTYLVPFLGASAFVSQPIAPSAIDMSLEDEEPGTRMRTPKFTHGVMLSGGLKLPLEVKRHWQRVNVLAGGHMLYMNDNEEDQTGSGLFAGLEFVY